MATHALTSNMNINICPKSKRSQLTIEELIKIILGIAVVVAVIIAVYLVFKNNIISFFKNVPTNSNSIKLILLLI